jgi:hypothetical protein
MRSGNRNIECKFCGEITIGYTTDSIGAKKRQLNSFGKSELTL